MDYSTTVYFSIDTLASRIPILLPSFGNLIRPLPNLVWMAILALILVMSLLFMTINKTYLLIDNQINRGEEDRLTLKVGLADFFIRTFSTITEPEVIPWFPKWSAGSTGQLNIITILSNQDNNSGRLLVLVWYGYCMFIIFFYTSNLRAFLIAPAREDFINRPEQVLERNKGLHIPRFYRLAR